MSTNTNIFDVNKKFVDLVGLDYFWGKAKGYIDTADANLASDLADLAAAVEALKGTGEGSVADQIAALATTLRGEADAEKLIREAAEKAISDDLAALDTKLYGDGTEANKGDLKNLEDALKAYANTAEADAKAYVDEKLGAYATTGEDGSEVPATGIRAEIAAKEKALSDAIDAVEAAAKSYSVAAVTGDELAGLGANVKEAYKLVDEDSAQAGEYIKIYKDSALQSVALNDKQELVFTYLLADGSTSVVPVSVASFLAESEFGDGLQVNSETGVVSVKVDATSEGFLTVVEKGGIKLSGVQDAIDAAANGVSADLAALEAQLYGTTGENPTEGDLAKMKAYLEKYADEAVAVEAGDRKNADDALQAAIDALTKQLYGEDGSENVGDLATMKAELKAYADQAEADALAAANTYTDELFESVKFVTEEDINGLSAGWAYPVAE